MAESYEDMVIRANGTQKFVVNGFEVGLSFTLACSGVTVNGK